MKASENQREHKVEGSKCLRKERPRQDSLTLDPLTVCLPSGPFLIHKGHPSSTRGWGEKNWSSGSDKKAGPWG
jgi:hypothetical protein